MKLLFVNACIRGDKSRTLRLCKKYIDEFIEKNNEQQWEIEEINLDKEDIKPIDSEILAERDALLAKKEFDNPMFKWANQIIEADYIVIGAPYWEFTFPAKLRIYIERCSVTGLTYVYGEDGIPKGKAKAKELAYITTSGGKIGSFNCGYDFIKAICMLFGIEKTSFFSAECLDIIGNDVEQILTEAESKISQTISKS